jgi:hypothetical protein
LLRWGDQFREVIENGLDLFVVAGEATLELFQFLEDLSVRKEHFAHLPAGRQVREKTRMIWMLTRMACSLFKTLDSMATPCSVKAMGSTLEPPRSESISSFEVPNWYLKVAHSAAVSSNLPVRQAGMKSSGKRPRFLLTWRLRCLVSTP